MKQEKQMKSEFDKKLKPLKKFEDENDIIETALLLMEVISNIKIGYAS